MTVAHWAWHVGVVNDVTYMWPSEEYLLLDVYQIHHSKYSLCTLQYIVCCTLCLKISKDYGLFE